MPKLGTSLAHVSAGCQKPKCDGPGIQRHHTHHEAMWLGVWKIRRRGETRWAAFAKRYHEFRAEDIVVLCARHHCEIHFIYDKLIEQHRASTGIAFSQYSWKQAEELMGILHTTCMRWLRDHTPGMEPLLFERWRRKQSAQAKARHLRNKKRG